MPIGSEESLETHARLRIVSLGKIRYSRRAHRIRVLRGGLRHFHLRPGAALSAFFCPRCLQCV